MPWNPQLHRQGLVGTCMITTIKGDNNQPNSRIYVASLITSYHYGRLVDPPDEILANTAKALESYETQIRLIQESNRRSGLDPVGDVWAVKFNSGLFRVPWEQTKAIIEARKIHIVVVEPADNATPGRGKKRKWTEEVSEGSDANRSLGKGTDIPNDRIEDREDTKPDVWEDRSMDEPIKDRGSQRPAPRNTRSATDSTQSKPTRPQTQTSLGQVSTRGVARPVKRKIKWAIAE